MREKILQRIDKSDRDAIILIPSPKTKTIRSDNKIFIILDNQSVELSTTDTIIWSLIRQNKSFGSVVNSALKILKLTVDYIEVIDNIIRSFYQLGFISLVFNDHVVKVKSWEQSAKRTIHFSITSKCNLQCVHCCVVPKKLPELTTQEALNVIDQVVDLGAELINFSGGEVFTRKDLEEILSHSRKYNIITSINTNATLINKSKVYWLRKIGIDTISVSLYGANSKNHESITRIPGSFNLTTHAIKMLRNIGMKVVIKSMVFKNNYLQMKGLKTFAESYGCDIVFDPHIFPRRNGSCAPLCYEIPDKKLYEVMKDHLRLSPKIKRTKMKPICAAGEDRLAITSYGEIYPCAIFPMTLGTVKDDLIGNIISKSILLRDFTKASVLDIDKCSKCFHNTVCSICPGAAYIENRNYLNVSQRACKLNLIRFTKT